MTNALLPLAATSAADARQAVAENTVAVALLNAVELWAEATTGADCFHRPTVLGAKRFAAVSFFRFAGKDMASVMVEDVRRWRADMEARHKPATVYARLSRLTSFYEWVMQDAMLGEFIKSNPARLVRPKAPRAYQTESAKAWTDAELQAILRVVTEKAQSTKAVERIVGLRDRALLLMYITTGMRRNEVIALRGSNIELRDEDLVVWARVKGGDYTGMEVCDPQVRAALLDYLAACGRMDALSTDKPLWTRHDRAGRTGAALSSHSFAKNLKRYAESVGLKNVHIHQTRHTFARIVAEDTGSMIETQDALGHRNLSTTRVYVNRIAIKRDKHSRNITARFQVGLPDDERV
jgi:integrase